MLTTNGQTAQLSSSTRLELSDTGGRTLELESRCRTAATIRSRLAAAVGSASGGFRAVEWAVALALA